MKTFLTKFSAKLNLNGSLSTPVPVKCGIRQGCPLSMLLFLIGMEPLNQKILSSTKIQGIFLGSTSLKVSHYADDLSLFISSPDSFNPIRQIIKKFSFFSGLKINQCKTTIISNSPVLLSSYRSTFPQEKFFHLQKFLKLISPFKAKIYPKTGMTSFAPSILYSCYPQS